MSTEELLKPRYKVMELYPFCPYMEGQLIKYSDDGNWFLSVFILYDAEGSRVEKCIYHRIETVDKYPHLFQKLEWWQERKPEEMPEYVKFNQVMRKYKFGEVVPVFNWYKYPYACIYHSSIYCECLLPATIDDYNSYQSSKHL